MEHKLSAEETAALKILEEMPEEEFQKFFKSLPYRVQLLCQGGLVAWKEVLPQWYVKSQSVEEGRSIYE